ncbi:family 43 glycosylhydrolase [Arachidicoccus ginsenosidivorans]|uniref:Family 43 glycosylhydrolase n=1 Tax=Arachidicoccus ginsenosidivorans TaxID=496057 RepID=A0A5B8VL92_9BACT|nr:arabinan endo-1,5-alpha-L-arabinosidase [Arachidicoccus ginsenosidivorans]QEC72109.1 family 43 glycosylhydrolase [Arachidicoccus ginsenosidivorans]
MKRTLTIFLAALLFYGCSKDGGDSIGKTPAEPDTTTTTTPETDFDINSIEDTYGDVASFDYYTKWGSYNVHDPSIKKFGDTYYCYSTDVAYGTSVRPGIQIRKSKDLVQWTFVGWVFSGLPSLASNYIKQKGGTPNDGIWAPYIMKVGSEYRLYYALSSSTARLSAIGLATASSPTGPWTEKGLVVTSADDASIQTNAIDPTVIATESGEYYMYYGSAWDGIYVLKLDPETGLAASSGDRGSRIANRGFTGGDYNGNIEAPEIIYNKAQKKYYLFIAYDWLETKYNTRVCRADKPIGPFYDFNGADANTNMDHGPMITAPYKFTGHGGWQGVSHVSVFDDDNGQYFIAHQGRPSVDPYFMDLQVRKLFWTADGWPVASPERYAWENNDAATKGDLTGAWDFIVLNYSVVPGYGDKQTSADLQVATTLNIMSDGSVKNGSRTGTWTYNAPVMQISWSDGTTDKVMVHNGHDWEKTGRPVTYLFTGLNNAGTAIWGKNYKFE